MITTKSVSEVCKKSNSLTYRHTRLEHNTNINSETIASLVPRKKSFPDQPICKNWEVFQSPEIKKKNKSLETVDKKISDTAGQKMKSPESLVTKYTNPRMSLDDIRQRVRPKVFNGNKGTALPLKKKDKPYIAGSNKVNLDQKGKPCSIVTSGNQANDLNTGQDLVTQNFKPINFSGSGKKTWADVNNQIEANSKDDSNQTTK